MIIKLCRIELKFCFCQNLLTTNLKNITKTSQRQQKEQKTKWLINQKGEIAVKAHGQLKDKNVVSNILFDCLCIYFCFIFFK